MRGALVLGLGLAVAAPALAQDRPVFPPEAPFHAVASFPDGMTGEIRYQDGKARIDASSPSGPATVYLDIPARSAVIALSMQGMNMGLEVDLAEFGLPDPASVTAEMVGADAVLGEPCTRWRFRDPKTGRPGIACITPDGIPLKAQDGVEGSPPAMEVTALQRGPQDAAALVPPPGLSTMKATGLSNLPIPLPIPGLAR